MTLSPKLAALTAFPELAQYYKSAEKYQEDGGYSHPTYVRVIGSGTFTLMQNRQWGNTEHPVTVTGVAVVGGWSRDNAVPVHHTEANKALFAENWPTDDQGVAIITDGTLRGWREAAPYREAEKARTEQRERAAQYRREADAKATADYARAEELARGLTVKHGVKFNAERSNYGLRVTVSLAEAEKLWGIK